MKVEHPFNIPKQKIEKYLSSLDFVDKYFIKIKTSRFSTLLVYVWVINHLYTIHLLSGNDKLEKLIVDIAKPYPIIVDIYN